MELPNFIRTIVGYFQRKPQVEVYCQTCGADLTGKPARIMNDGGIYCNQSSSQVDGATCFEEALIAQFERGPLDHGYIKLIKPREIPRAIKDGRLTKFGKLETL